MIRKFWCWLRYGHSWWFRGQHIATIEGSLQRVRYYECIRCPASRVRWEPYR